VEIEIEIVKEIRNGNKLQKNNAENNKNWIENDFFGDS
jgi:hypothetical protein